MAMTARDADAWRGSTSENCVDCASFKVLARTSRLWRPGEVVSPGQYIGNTINGTPVLTSTRARITGIQYDVETDEVILIVDSLDDRA